MAISDERLEAVRRGHSGLALVLYIDTTEDEYDEKWQDFPEVIALDKETGGHVLGELEALMKSGQAEHVHDAAAKTITLLLSTELEWQALLAPLLEGIAGKRAQLPIASAI